MKVSENQPRLNFKLTMILLGLTIISLVNLFSASSPINSSGVSSVFVSQLVWYILGWGFYLGLSQLSLNVVKRMAWLIYFANLGLLVAVKLIGKSFNGAQRWLDFGFFRFQPSETMKVALVLVLGLVLSRYITNRQLTLKNLLYPIGICAIPFILVASQPDLGTSLLMFIVGGTMTLFLGIQRKLLIVSSVLFSLSLPLVWTYGLKPYQKQRVHTFLNPGSDLRGGGYNSRQSKIAVGSGLLFGRGYRQGTQSQLKFLPERHTDFIFSVLSEEHGFAGSLLTLFLFFMLFLNLISIASQSMDPFGTLITIGIGSIVFWHFFINIGMITGILPVVGMPLPFLSYGGSSILTTMSSLGLVAQVSRKRYLF